MKLFGKILLWLLALLIAAFLLCRTPDTDPAEMRAKYGGAPSQFLELENGQIVHVRDDGPRDGLPIILLHGSNADLHTWQPWVDGLKQDYRVIRFDQRGHGLTGPAADGDYTLAAYVEDVGRITQALGIDRYVLAGNSMGGSIAAALAMQYPERLIGLVLVDAGGAPDKSEAEGNIGFTIAAMPGLNRIAEQVTPRSLVEKSLVQSVANADIVTDEMIDRYWELLRYPGNRRATLVRFSIPKQAFPEAAIARIPTPSLILWGEKDPLIAVEGAYWYAKTLPDAKLVVYPGIGHLPHEEAPERSLHDLREWLSSIKPPVNTEAFAGNQTRSSNGYAAPAMAE